MLYISRIFKPAFKIQYSSLSSNLIKCTTNLNKITLVSILNRKIKGIYSNTLTENFIINITER